MPFIPSLVGKSCSYYTQVFRPNLKASLDHILHGQPLVAANFPKGHLHPIITLGAWRGCAAPSSQR